MVASATELTRTTTAMPEQAPAAYMPPPPETLSAEARAYLSAVVPLDPSQAIDVVAMRPFAEQIQRHRGR